jgi:hypothetical protein
MADGRLKKELTDVQKMDPAAGVMAMPVVEGETLA